MPSAQAQNNDSGMRPSTTNGEPSLVRGPARTLPPRNESGLPQATTSPTYIPNGNAIGSHVSPASFQSPTTQSSPQPVRSRNIELKPPSTAGAGAIEKPTSNWGTFLSVLFSLAIVLSLFFGVAWMAKRSLPQSSSKLPNEVVQVLGRTTLAPRQQIYVVRFGRRLLLVSQQPGHTQTLGEINEEEEVERLAGICEATLPSSSSRSFSDVLKQVAYGKADRTSTRRRSA